MNSQIIYDFAEIDSEHELVVHLGLLDDVISVWDLANVMNVPAAQIVFALGLASNDSAARHVYRNLRETLDGFLPGGIGPLPPDEGVALPPEEDLGFGEVDPWLRLIMTQYGGGDSTWNWHLPAEGLYLPLTPVMLKSLQRFTAASQDYGVPHALGAALTDPEALERLRSNVVRLERAIAAKYDAIEHGTTSASFLAGIDLAAMLVRFQDRHWWSEARKGNISAEERDRLPCVARSGPSLARDAWRGGLLGFRGESSP